MTGPGEDPARLEIERAWWRGFRVAFGAALVAITAAALLFGWWR